jgi:hypothetical protein
MITLSDDEARQLARSLASVLDAEAPGWADANLHDPGVTLLQVMAFLSDVIVYRPPSAEAARLATHVLDRLRNWTSTCGSGDLERVNYFSGQLLTADDLRDDQNYHRGKLRRLIGCLYFQGVVNGLDVQLSGDAGNGRVGVNVGPGCAVTKTGELVVIDCHKACTLAAVGVSGFVSIFYAEHEVGLVPGDDLTDGHASRVKEGVEIAFTADSPTDGVALARLTRDDSGWHVDSTFAPARARG